MKNPTPTITVINRIPMPPRDYRRTHTKHGPFPDASAQLDWGVELGLLTDREADQIMQTIALLAHHHKPML